MSARLAKLVLFSCLGVLRAAEGMDHQHGDAASSLPEAAEKADVMKYCTLCHGIERVQHSGGTDAGWQDRIQRMVRWGAKIPQERIAEVAAYLASALPLRPRPPASLSYFANTAVSEVAVQDIQRTIRWAAHPAADGQLRIDVGPQAEPLLALGQRARVFAVDARSVMIPATIVRLIRRQGAYEVTLRTARPMAGLQPSTAYLAEVVVSSGRFLAIPNDAIIEDGGSRRVYVEEAVGEYAPREVELGMQGDQVTQVLAGLSRGEQVVTLGNFFIDAEHRMNLAQ